MARKDKPFTTDEIVALLELTIEGTLERFEFDGSEEICAELKRDVGERIREVLPKGGK